MNTLDSPLHDSIYHWPELDHQGARGLGRARLVRVLEYLHEHVDERVSVRDLAATVNMSPFHFARMFKESVGVPPHVYLTRIRIERARQFLARSNLPLAQIATRIGYQTQAHFTSVFRKHSGTTPAAYRMQQTRGAVA